MSRPTVAVIGASTDRKKFGNKAVRAFQNAGFDVYQVHPSAPEIEGLRAYASLDEVPLEQIDRVSLYVAPQVGLTVLDQVARKQVGEVWLNPGTESPEVVARAESLGLNVIQDCSILGVGQDPSRL